MVITSMPGKPSEISTNRDNSSISREGQAPFVDIFAERVRALAAGRRYNAASLGKEVGVSSSSAALYWSGKRPWPSEILPKLAAKLGTTIDYLFGRTDDAGVIDFHGSPSDFEALADDVSRKRGRRSLGKTADGELVEVAEIDPSFGLGAVFMDEAAAPEMRAFSRAWLRQITTSPPEELYWARGRGNSMVPTIAEGELVLIDRRHHSPRDADLIWAFAWGHIGYIKRLRPMPDGSVKILSDNPAVSSELAPGDEINIFGRVVAVVKNL